MHIGIGMVWYGMVLVWNWYWYWYGIGIGMCYHSTGTPKAEKETNIGNHRPSFWFGI
jgi:hypothetical protein